MVSSRNIETCRGKTIFLEIIEKPGIIEFYWKRGEDMTSNVFTKNLSIPQFEKSIKVFIGEYR